MLILCFLLKRHAQHIYTRTLGLVVRYIVSFIYLLIQNARVPCSRAAEGRTMPNDRPIHPSIHPPTHQFHFLMQCHQKALSLAHSVHSITTFWLVDSPSNRTRNSIAVLSASRQQLASFFLYTVARLVYSSVVRVWNDVVRRAAARDLTRLHWKLGECQ